MKTYAIDIDNTICKTNGSDYVRSVPNTNIIEAVNRLYDAGNIIKIYTGRGSRSGLKWRELTEKQLSQWGVKYHELVMGKPHFDLCLDDKMMSLSELFRNETLDSCLIAEMVKAFKNGNKILVCGNGGLAAESSHFSAEFVGKYGGEIYLPAISLVDNTSLVTAISNDFGYESVFSHQVEVMGNKGDILIGMTTSQSKNIIEALIKGKQKGLMTVGICAINSMVCADYVVRVWGKDVAEIQNQIIRYLHELAYEVKRKYAKCCVG